MVTETVRIVNQMGFHMRPAGMFAREMQKFQSSLTILCNGKSIDGKSVMQIMAGCMKQGAELVLRCDGPDEREMLETAAGLIRGGLGEE
ncbi:MAG: HPr family phosphocarrier protein [Clostridiales bacterium]|nr:HPr family phosphocarrier protein [Clostridiales bacterium]